MQLPENILSNRKASRMLFFLLDIDSHVGNICSLILFVFPAELKLNSNKEGLFIRNSQSHPNFYWHKTMKKKN